MKKIITIFLASAIWILAVACQKNEIAEPVVTEITESVATTTQQTTTKPLPQYIPGSVKLRSIEYWEEEFDLSYKMKYRLCYYRLPGWVEDLGNSMYQKSNDYVTEEIAENRNPNGPSEMTLVKYLKRYPIPKNIFEAELEKYIKIEKEIAKSIGHEPDDEWHELPNADIIYTFDNEIINEYYRRE